MLPADPAGCAVSRRSCGDGIFSTEKVPSTNRWLWSRRHTRSRTTPLREVRRDSDRERRQSGSERNRHRCASRDARWRVPRYCENLAPEAQVIKLGLLSTQTGFDIAENFAAGELSEAQTKELIPAGKFFDVAIALVAINANLKL